MLLELLGCLFIGSIFPVFTIEFLREYGDDLKYYYRKYRSK